MPSNAISTTSSGRTWTVEAVLRVSNSSRRAVCHARQLVREALERLAEHDEPARLRVARSQVQVREQPLPPSVAPLDGEHHEVERVDGLDLDPAGAAPAGLVGRARGLDHDALVPSGQRVVEELPCRRRLGGDDARHPRAGGHERLDRGQALARGEVEEVAAVQMQDVEEERRERHRCAQRRAVRRGWPHGSPSPGTGAAGRRAAARSPRRRGSPSARAAHGRPPGPPACAHRRDRACA